MEDGRIVPIFVRSLSAQSSECVFSMLRGLSNANAPAQKRAIAVVMVVNFMVDGSVSVEMCQMCWRNREVDLQRGFTALFIHMQGTGGGVEAWIMIYKARAERSTQ